MAISRRSLQCRACQTRVVTRTAIGHSSPQEQKFPCPTCGVIISYSLIIDLKKPKFSYSDLQNARWIETEKEGDKEVFFDPERPFPIDASKILFSPFLLDESGKLTDAARIAFSREEGKRLDWRDSYWPWIKRLIVHFNKRNKSLFDKESKFSQSTSDPKNWLSRLSLLYSVIEGAFYSFTITKKSEQDRVEQRIALSKAISISLFKQLVNEYKSTNRIDVLWEEINELRSCFLENYIALQPLLRMRYWKNSSEDLSDLQFSVKRFESLKGLYIDCFETLCRLIVIVVGIESIVHFNDLKIPTSKKLIDLWEFEELANGNKPAILKKFPIHDLFVPLIDNKLRNGLGHNSAAYSHEKDEISYRKSKGGVIVEKRLSYTEFCDKVFRLYSGVELAGIYLRHIHLEAVADD